MKTSKAGILRYPRLFLHEGIEEIEPYSTASQDSMVFVHSKLLSTFAVLNL